jgi:hypothetical protein
VVDGMFYKGGLADSCLAADDGDPPQTSGNVLNQGAEHSQLTVAFE